MVISVGHNNIICETEGDFEKNLKEQLELESAEIWVSEHGLSDEYPCFVILINGKSASLTFFGDDGSCFVSVGGGSDTEVIPFCSGQYEVAGNQIINKNDALEVLMKFFSDRSRSNSIMWEQLY